MKIALVAFSDTQEYRLQIKKEMIHRGHKCDLLPFSVLPINLEMIDYVYKVLVNYDIVHFVLGFNEEITRVLQTRLMDAGVICPNVRIKNTYINDKIVQMVALVNAKVPVPKSIRLVQPDRNEILKHLNFPFVLKEPVGSKGEKVFLCKEDNFDTVIQINKEYLAQEFIDYESDYRVHVVGDRAFCLYERTAPRGDFRANVSIGGSMKSIGDEKQIEELSSLAVRATKALNMDYGGVDIIKDKQGNLFVIEFNPNPGFKNVTEVTGTPFYLPIADYYEEIFSKN